MKSIWYYSQPGQALTYFKNGIRAYIVLPEYDTEQKYKVELSGNDQYFDDLSKAIQYVETFLDQSENTINYVLNKNKELYKKLSYV